MPELGALKAAKLMLAQVWMRSPESSCTGYGNTREGWKLRVRRLGEGLKRKGLWIEGFRGRDKRQGLKDERRSWWASPLSRWEWGTG